MHHNSSYLQTTVCPTFITCFKLSYVLVFILTVQDIFKKIDKYQEEKLIYFIKFISRSIPTL